MKFFEMYKDEEEGLWISNQLNNSDFNYHLAIRSFLLPDDSICVTLECVSPEEAPKDLVQQELQDLCVDFDINNYPKAYQEKIKCEVLVRYGATASFWHSKQGQSYTSAIKEAKVEAKKSQTFFGFYMDKPQNAIGTNGWNFIKGEI